MGDLRDQLKKAKLLSDKKARRLAHEERVHRKTAGREGLVQERKTREDELRRLREAEKARTARAQEELDRRRAEAAERAACLELLDKETFQPRRGGNARWYFELDDGALPYLEVDAQDLRRLTSGACAVVLMGPTGSHAYALLPSEHARRVSRVFPERVVWAVRGVRNP